MLASADWVHWLESLITWGPLLAAIDFVIVCVAVSHVVLKKRDIRAAIGWSGVIFLAPFVGTALYVLFGINRLKRRARKLLGKSPEPAAEESEPVAFESSRLLDARATRFGPLAVLGDKVIGRPLVGGNRIELYSGSEPASAAMLDAIERATQSITLCTYIFDNDRIGKKFVEALRAAQERGVAIRVIIDGVGMRYSCPSIRGLLAHAKVPYAVFLPN